MDESVPPGASPRPCALLESRATTLEGALADFWTAVCAATEPVPGSPSLRVLFLPEVLQDFETMEALTRHLKVCRDCSSVFGRGIKMQSLHPDEQQFADPEDTSRRGTRPAPCAAFTLSARAGSSAPLRPPLEGDEEPTDGEAAAAKVERERLEAARASLEKLIAPPAPPPPPPRPPETAEQAMAATIEWFGSYYERVARVVGDRQRRVLVPSGDGERVYRAFWREAALLLGGQERLLPVAPPADAAGGGQPGPTKEVSRPSAPAVADSPGAPDYRWTSASATPLSSLIVLPALTDDVDSFRKLVASLKLGLAALQLDGRLRVSAFHPRDTFEIQTDSEGNRKWLMSLPHPMLHVVLASPPT